MYTYLFIHSATCSKRTTHTRSRSIDRYHAFPRHHYRRHTYDDRQRVPQPTTSRRDTWYYNSPTAAPSTPSRLPSHNCLRATGASCHCLEQIGNKHSSCMHGRATQAQAEAAENDSILSYDSACCVSMLHPLWIRTKNPGWAQQAGWRQMKPYPETDVTSRRFFALQEKRQSVIRFARYQKHRVPCSCFFGYPRQKQSFYFR